jgi:uncharacterized NAD(P)/FAD-binding protein YdhS
MKTAKQHGEPWQIVLDTLRPRHQELWQSLPTTEQERFIRHLSSYWEVHRHRLAPELHHTISTLIDRKKLVVHKGPILHAAASASGIDLTLRARGSHATQLLSGSHLFLCTGPARSLQAWDNPLIEGLIEQKYLEQDALGIGFRPTAIGNEAALQVLGTALRGTLWESTAMRELSMQAKEVAQRILSEDGLGRQNT